MGVDIHSNPIPDCPFCIRRVILSHLKHHGEYPMIERSFLFRRSRLLTALLLLVAAICMHGCAQPGSRKGLDEKPKFITSVMDLKEAPVWDALDLDGYQFNPVSEPGDGRFENGLYYIPEMEPMETSVELRRIDLADYRDEKVIDLDASTGAVHDFAIGPDGRFLYVLLRPRRSNVDMTDLIKAARGKSEHEKIDIMEETLFTDDKCILMVYDIAASDYVSCENEGTLVDGITLHDLPDFGVWPRRLHPGYLILPAYNGYSHPPDINFRQFLNIDLKNLDLSDFTVPFSGNEPTGASAGSTEGRPEIIKIETSGTGLDITEVTFFSFAHDGSNLFRRVFDTSTRLFSSEIKLDWPGECIQFKQAQNDLSPLICARVLRKEGNTTFSSLEASWGENIYEIMGRDSFVGPTLRGAFFINQAAFIIPVDNSLVEPWYEETEARFKVLRLDINSGETEVIYEYTGKYGSMSPIDFAADLKEGMFAGSMNRLSDGEQPGVSRLFIYDVASGEIIRTIESERGFSTPRYFMRKSH